MNPDAPTKTRKKQLAKKKAPKRVFSPTSRSDAAQRTGARTKKVVRLGPPTPKPEVRGTKGPKRAASFKKGDTYKTVRKREVKSKQKVQKNLDKGRIVGKTGGGDFKKKGPGFFSTASLPFLPDAIVRNPKGAAKTTGKILENTIREGIQIPSSIVPSAVHVGKPVYDNPTSPKAYKKTAERVGEAVIALPKEYVKAIDKKGLKGAGELFVKKPLSTGLTVAPIPRGPGIIAGGVARRAGKMPRTAPRELPGTAMKVQDRTSKSYFKAKRDAKKPKKEVNDADIDTRVDEQVALMENLSRTEQAARYKKTYRDRKKVVGKKQAVREAAEHAGKVEKKVRDEQKHAIAQGMGLRNNIRMTSSGKLVSPGGDLKTLKSQGEAQIFADKYNANSKTSVEMTPFKTKGGYAVVPSSMKKRLEQHEAKSEVGWLGAGLKGYNTLWRKNVLALHPSWYTGNVIEAAGRSLVAGVGPTSYVRGFKYQVAHRAIDREGAKVAKGHTTSGGHLKMQARLPEETKSDITGHGFLADTARKVQAFRDNPKGPKQTADLFNNFTDFTMGTLSGKAESFFQTGMLGKELARSPLMDGHVNKTSKAAIEDAVKGMKETHNQVALGQAVDRMYGKYGKFSPGRRKMISHYTPFIAWTLNSLEFLGKVLPVDHPVLTAAVASSQPYVEEWLADEGLSPFVKGALPSFLQGSVPSKKGYARYPTRYLPTSVAAGFPESAVGALLPQLEPAYNLAVHGINWKGQKVNNPDGTPLDPIQLSLAAALTLFEGAMPGAQQIASPSERYGTEGARTPGKLLKPKPTGEIVESFTNPFTKVKKKESTKKKKNNLDSLIGGSEKPKVKKSKANTLDSLINP